MAHHFANKIPTRLLMWQRVREYAVPPSMIETATARRAVGDWAGACAAARIDVDLDLRAVRDRHGTDLVTHLRADLRRLAPDLLRWHMFRIAPDGWLRPGLTISLARYRSSGATPLQLVVRTPPAWADAGQRMSLALWEGSGNSAPGHHPHPHPHPHPDRRFRLDLHRHLWDSGRSGELARRCGAGGARSAAPPDRPTVDDPPWAVGRWAAEAELLLRAEGRPRGAFTVRLGARSRAVLELVAPDESHAPTFRPLREALPPQEVAALPALPEASARVPPDLELLWAGLVTAERLHPLVAVALGASGSAPVAGPGPEPGDPHRVECRGEVHRIAPRDGVLTAIDHDAAQLRREELLVALGGPALPCLRAIDAVHRNPEALPAVRERLGHGDVAGALAVVEGLLGPGAVLRDGPLREELESAAARRIDHGLFRSGLVAVHPGAGVAGGGNASGVGHAEAGHRPRLDRRTPPAMRRKRSSRARPRTGLTC
ncbi:hypothetical protein [Streptomyces sp. ME19-01-6]|uniref:hypothetical protein n=1 Tax=Streptomyces sp. ME19-01-6 TaxID=3028686 RepID=UPI00299FC577|nr:hypothetical protein [Streptomyces sp. ME19-01-6]MDX3226269.1 hypothetical protein [Streptomyces sp. ME19-01-6]